MTFLEKDFCERYSKHRSSYKDNLGYKAEWEDNKDNLAHIQEQIRGKLFRRNQVRQHITHQHIAKTGTGQSK